MEKDTFLAAVEATIKQYDMLHEGDTVVVGVSGGPDSVALLHTLISISAGWSLRLVVAHLNHKLRGSAADEEAAFVGRLARSLGIPCEIQSENVSKFRIEQRLSLQEAARTIRYAFYDDVASRHGADKIALGHQAHDNAESVLIHLLRGTGPRGLSGIPPVRTGRIIRPFIHTTRQDILTFLGNRGIEYVRDRSNADLKYLRNRIRHELLPHLEEHYNPNVVSALNRLASIIRDEEKFLDLEANRTFDKLSLEKRSDCVTLPVGKLSHIHPALLRRLIRRAVSHLTGNVRRFGHVHVEAVSRLITGGSPSGHLDLPKGVGVILDRQEIKFFLRGPEEPPAFEYDIPGLQTTVIEEIGITLKLSECLRNEVSDPKTYPREIALFDMDTVTFPLKVRNFRAGDRFSPLGMSGSQKVKAFFINQKVPQSERKRCPILLSGENILWLVGYRTAESAKITEQTKRVLKAELLSP